MWRINEVTMGKGHRINSDRNCDKCGSSHAWFKYKYVQMDLDDVVPTDNTEYMVLMRRCCY